MKKTTTRINTIRKTLKTTYPHVKTQLRHKNAFQLLIATILSAQCTDRQVNSVTESLFKKLPEPENFATADIKTIEKLIHSTGFFHNKARNIKNCCKALIERYNGEVPDKLEELLTLPGVGRKTANVVLGAAFGVPGMVVDTHVARISKRLGLTENDDPVKIEFDLMKIIHEKEWNDFSLYLIYFGRETCKARNPACPACPLKHLCDWPEKTTESE